MCMRKTFTLCFLTANVYIIKFSNLLSRNFLLKGNEIFVTVEKFMHIVITRTACVSKGS